MLATILGIAASSAVNVGSAYPYKFLTLQPTYVINDWDAASPIASGITKNAKGPSSRLMYCGWATTRSLRSTSTVGGYAVQPGDRLFGRLAFPDADALLEYVKGSRDGVQALLDGPASLDTLEVHGPAEELEKCRSALDDDAQYFVIGSGLSRIEREIGGPSLPLQLLSLVSTFEVRDDAATEAICDELVERTGSETDCLYCGWTRCGSQLCLREAFGSVVGIAKHVANVEDQLASLLDGPASLVRNDLHTSLANLRLFDEYIGDTERKAGYASAETTKWYGEEGAFSTYDVQQSMFGFFIRR